MNTITKEQRAALVEKIEPLRQRVEAWRTTRRSNEKMPEELWAPARELAKEYGVSPVQGILRIDYRGLERRVFGGRRPGREPARAAPPRAAFVELPVLPPPRRVEHTVELEDALGRRMTLRVSGGPLAEWLPLAEAFWRTKP